jgi:hypothetical protein
MHDAERGCPDAARFLDSFAPGWCKDSNAHIRVLYTAFDNPDHHKNKRKPAVPARLRVSDSTELVEVSAELSRRAVSTGTAQSN